MIQVKYGSDLIVDILNDHQIKYVSCNPGATFRGIHDSIVNTSHHQLEIISCCHEEISVAIAHGYAKASGHYMAVLVHNIVGLQHASMAIFNAWCDRVPILVVGATGPLDITQRRPWIDWIHSSNQQSVIVKDYVKWDDQPYGISSVSESLYRGCRILNTEPKGPVYICIDAAIQEEEIKNEIEEYKSENFIPPYAPSINQAHLRQLSDHLINAELPIIIVDYSGRDSRSVNLLVKLVELLSIPVIDCGGRYNFPNTHPLCITGVDKKFISKADFILAFDVQDLYGVFGDVEKRSRSYRNYLRQDTVVAHVTLSDYIIRGWAADYHKLCPTDIPIAADSTEVLFSLVDFLEKNLDEKTILSHKKRYNEISLLHSQLRNEWLSFAIAKKYEKPLSVAAVLHEVWLCIKDEDIVLTNNANTSIGKWTRNLWNLEKEGCYLGNSGGVGLGYGIGASIGAALAYKETEKLCVDIQTDGDLLYTPSALWTAAHHDIPLLVILMNNRTYYNSEEHAIELAKHRSRDQKNAGIGTKILDPFVDFTNMAISFGVSAFGPIEDLESLRNAVVEAIRIVKEKKSLVIIDVIIQPR
jgi:acetolactate synthase I/II/III large subunit